MIFISQIFDNYGVFLGAAILTFIIIMALLTLLLPLFVYQIKCNTSDLVKEIKLLRAETYRKQMLEQNDTYKY